MSRTFTTLASALGAAALTAAVAVAQQPRLTNGKVTAQPGAGAAAGLPCRGQHARRHRLDRLQRSRRGRRTDHVLLQFG